IFLDETLSFLDINHQIEIMQLLQEIHLKQNKSIVIVSHNINLSIEYSDKLIILKNGEILAQGNASDIISREIIQKTFNLDIHIINNPITNKPNLLYSNSRSL
ncbi:MAG: ABC transporter ATP-binding protein, partial [Candidatus Cloacimonetes bacterium]|nr:ABC transporter ATP-binding protein [Candidatus Cloacimonadota bacterium]